MEQEVKNKWNIFHDNGAGVTDASLKTFESVKGKLGKIYYIYLDDKANFNFQMEGENGWLLLSGFSCGYGGTGPHGAITALSKLGFRDAEMKQIERDVVEKKRLYYAPQGLISW